MSTISDLKDSVAFWGYPEFRELAMFRKITKLFSKTPPALQEPTQPSMSPKELAAFEKGREISQTQITQIEHYIGWRFDQIRAGYLQIIQKQVDRARDQEEYSPLLVARVEYSEYLENVKKAQDRLKAEVFQHHHEWSELNKQLGVEDLIEKWLDQTLSDKFSGLSLEGLTVMTDNADILKRADDNWRARNPALAVQQPLD